MLPEALPLRTMELEITPEPTPQERAAIERALAALRRGRVESSWWQPGNDSEPDGAGPGAPVAPGPDRYSSSSNGWSTSQGAKPWRR